MSVCVGSVATSPAPLRHNACWNKVHDPENDLASNENECLHSNGIKCVHNLADFSFN